jgi:hypothetical protein
MALCHYRQQQGMTVLVALDFPTSVHRHALKRNLATSTAFVAKALILRLAQQV